MTVQPDLCWTCSEATLLVFSRDGSKVRLHADDAEIKKQNVSNPPAMQDLSLQILLKNYLVKNIEWFAEYSFDICYYSIFLNLSTANSTQLNVVGKRMPV